MSAAGAPSDVQQKATCYGDFISLCATEPAEGFMHAQALVLTRLGAKLTGGGGTLPPRFHEHVFRICPALRYEAQDMQRQRRHYSRANSMTAKELKEVEDQTRVEREKNENVILKLDAEPQPELLYGSKVQLLQ